MSGRAALARLPEIHAEAFEAAQLGHFLRAGASAAAMLMLLGVAALATAGGAGLEQEFVWVLLVLLGVGGMLRCTILSTAQAFDRIPLREAARDLRAVLLYTGFAWGAGAFLLLGDDPLPIMGLCFAGLPSAILTAMLRDKAAGFFFLGPVTLLTAAAMLLDHWGGVPVALAMLVVVQGSIGAGVVLAGRSQQTLPPGLSLP
ncbi:MAG TPA: hypothetical protein VHM27_01345 [Rhizomicrobium sp.]|nr:hypothetical protein [Rhizomicrobium sp.]